MIYQQHFVQEQVPKVSVLTKAFVDEKASKRAAAKGVAAPQPEDVDIRQEKYMIRSVLLTGERVPVYIGKDVIAEIRKPLLKPTSTKVADIYKEGAVILPEDTEKEGVKHLLGYMSYVAGTTKKPAKMRTALSTFDALSVCAAAKLMGVEKYTDNVYKAVDAYLHKYTPEYEDIDAILAFRTSHARFYNIVVDHLATLVWQETIPDPEEFQEYLRKNAILAKSIDGVNSAYKKQQAQKEKDERDTANWAAKNAKKARLEDSIRKKMQGPLEKRQKFDAEEKYYWINTYGKQPPKGCA
ncbi:hypothetical protein EK21DRAFT_65144 [Setomelanomma holmii]|uniref:Uncharacterized protein n=1 Tax=Setomelanomma holmii TaxID=210430 RepID=A0A9P4HC21_9PLEO|nr:hypothetical protein EK21DRAFT_65144 [Setomelanomma holmii]